jgi:hypothetical protein
MVQLGDLDWQRLSSATARERAEAFSDFYLPVTPASGRLLYALVRASRPNTVVEFRMSLGLSTIRLAAAVRDNGGGHRAQPRFANRTRWRSAAGPDGLSTLHGRHRLCSQRGKSPIISPWTQSRRPGCTVGANNARLGDERDRVGATQLA